MMPKGRLELKVSRKQIVYMVAPLFLLLVVFYILGSTQGFGNSTPTTTTPVSASATQSNSESIYANQNGNITSAQPTNTPAPAKAEPGFGFDTVVDIFFKLAIVIGLIYLSTKILRYMNRGAQAGPAEKLINVLETRSLPQNQMLYLVEVGGKAVLVGSTGSQLSTLTEITDTSTISLMKTQVETQVTPKDSFANYLQGFASRMQTNIQGNSESNAESNAESEINFQPTELLPVSRLQEATSFVRKLTNDARQSTWNTGSKPAQTLASLEDHSAAVR
jgi:flagellar biogenesis protein FliO